MTSRERARLERDGAAWRRFGPYLSERQWGTVREDYSPHGNAWDYFPHDHARARAYRWGEDGLAGFSDELSRLCLSVALWNGQDPILKERLFGLTNSEGNHGEDVKEHYYYLDATPTHAYLRMLYKYPQAAYPYGALVAGNRARGAHEPELELVDTGVFDEQRYFDVFVEYAKADPEDILLRVTVENRGPDAAAIHVIPQIWFRNTWTWTLGAERPSVVGQGGSVVTDHPELGRFAWSVDGDPAYLFTDNESNPALWGIEGQGHYKDAFHERIVRGREDATRLEQYGTKAGAWRHAVVPAGGSLVIRARLRRDRGDAFVGFDDLVEAARRDADDFYAELQEGLGDRDARHVQRQALAGMIWSKQFFHFDVREWLKGDETQPAPPAERRNGRNHEWAHLNNAEVLSMPDKWEYPWYAAWDLAFHCVPLSLVDPAFAKQQLLLLTREWYMHPNGQLPAYEWAFGDVNPPVHAWAAWKVYEQERQRTGAGDRDFLERIFHKLLLNFTWWVNRKDAEGRNIFQGGFLGLDNIGVFDRSAPLPTGGHIDQSDGTAWMAAYSLHLLRIALELARENPAYEDVATKFFEHFLHIAEAMTNMGGVGHGLWDEADGFYYDALHLPDGREVPLKVRSMVGLVPLFAVEVLEPELLAAVPGFTARLEWYLTHRPALAELVSRWNVPGRGEVRLLSLLRGSRMKKLLRRMLDEGEFLSPHGVRALSKVHQHEPFVLEWEGRRFDVTYLPAESTSGLFGGNSNWRGPVWFPMNYMLIDSLRTFHRYYGDDFRVECPVGSGRLVSVRDVADEVSRRLVSLFLRGPEGVRPFAGQYPSLARDPHFADHVLFHEYFDGDTGRGVGATHQTGWTGLVATLIDEQRARRKEVGEGAESETKRDVRTREPRVEVSR